MKKLFFFPLIVVILQLSFFNFQLAAAQPRTTPPVRHQAPPPAHFNLSFESQHGEAFNVFIDGDLQNRMPQTRVMVTGVTDQTHEVVVVLKRPAEKAAVLQLRPGERNVVVNVNYDSRLESLSLYTAAHNRADVGSAMPRVVDAGVRRPEVAAPARSVIPPVPLPPHSELRAASAEELAGMVQRMKNQPFDEDRLSLGKVIVASSNLTSMQIMRLAETIDFSNSRVEFLKYAYGYCIDPLNYYQTVDCLTFSSDKKKVLDYIATQR